MKEKRQKQVTFKREFVEKIEELIGGKLGVFGI